MSSANPVTFAIAGLGNAGRRHATILNSHPECRLVASLELNTDLTVSAGIPAFVSLDDLLKKGPHFDVLVIATPNGLHEAQAVQALRAGKHVVIEKPMALSTLGCQRIISTAEAQHLRVFTVMQNRFSPAYRWLKDILVSDILGRVYIVQVNCFWNRGEIYYRQSNWRGNTRIDGGILFTQFAHFIDTLVGLFGDIYDIQSRFTNFNHSWLNNFSDSAQVQFTLPQGGWGSLLFTVSCHHKNVESSISLIGEKGSVKLGGQYLEQIEYADIADYPLPDFATLIDRYGGGDTHRLFYNNVVNTLIHGANPIIQANESAQTVAIIERMMKAGVQTNETQT